jgi:hypothetical protein
MSDIWPQALETRMREVEGEEGQRLDHEMLNLIKDDLAAKVGVGPRNIFVDAHDSNLLRLEIGILYPIRVGAETTTSTLVSQLQPLGWWQVNVYLHPRTHRLIAEARRVK